MTRLTRLLLWLLSKRPDVYIDLDSFEEEPDGGLDALDYLEMCYGLDPAIHGDGSVYGEDSA
jgi:hypothetical protein